MGFGSVEITAAQQQGPEDTHRLDVTGFGGEPLPGLLGGITGFVPVRGLNEFVHATLKIGRR